MFSLLLTVKLKLFAEVGVVAVTSFLQKKSSFPVVERTEVKGFYHCDGVIHLPDCVME